MKVAFFGYRNWSIQVLHELNSIKDKDWLITQIYSQNPGFSSKESNQYFLEKIEEVDCLLFVGWSWYVPKDIVRNKLCLCVHPSPLPKYRGGSPIQHQILNGEKDSAVTVFRMNEKMDAGDIYSQVPYSLGGSMNEVLSNIKNSSVAALRIALDGIASGELKPKPQDEKEATVFKRRKEKDSKISFDDIIAWDADRLYNFIRALESPYPNAYLEYPNGDRVLFEKIKLIKAKE